MPILAREVVLSGRISMRKKMVLYLVIVVLLALSPFCFIRYFARNAISRLFSYRAEIDSERIVGELMYTIGEAGGQAEKMAFFFSTFLTGKRMRRLAVNMDVGELKRGLPEIIRKNMSLGGGRPSSSAIKICGSSVALVPTEFPRLGRFAPFYYLSRDGGLKYKDLALEGKGYENYEWFRRTVETKKAFWSEPYLDEAGSGLMIVAYSTPIIVGDKVMGVVKIDISIDEFRKMLDKMAGESNRSGYYLFVMNGRYAVGSGMTNSVASRDGLIDFRVLRGRKGAGGASFDSYIDHVVSFMSRIDEIADSDPSMGYGEFLDRLLENMGDLDRPFKDPVTGVMTRYYCSSVEFRAKGFYLLVATPESVVLKTLSNIQLRIAIMLGCILLFVAPFIVVISGFAAAPLKKLRVQAERYAEGDFEYRSGTEEKSLVKRLLLGASSEIAAVSEALNELGARLRDSFDEIRNAKSEMIRHLAIASEYRDTDTGKHVARVSGYSKVLARKAGLADSEVDQISEASIMHDVGKIGISDSILLKKGRLTDEEYSVMKKHTSIGVEILSDGSSKLLEKAEKVAGSHHEKWDGLGYPDGLKGDDIPIEGRIVAICDVFDALTTERPYKKPWPGDEAFAFIEKESGRSFDPVLVRLFLEARDEILRVKEEVGD